MYVFRYVRLVKICEKSVIRSGLEVATGYYLTR